MFVLVDLLSFNLSLNYSVANPGPVNYVAVLNDTLFALDWMSPNQLLELDKSTGQMHLVATLGDGQHRGIVRSSVSPQRLIMPAYVGLRVLDLRDNSLITISSSGQYKHVCESQVAGEHYAVRVDHGVDAIYVDKIEGEQLILGAQSQVPYNGDIYTIACVRPGEVYVCSDYQHQIHRVELPSGNVLSTYGQQGAAGVPGQLDNPFICFSDVLGRILVADKNNNQLQLFDTVKEEWSIVRVDVMGPKSAVIKDDQLFVAGEYVENDFFPVDTLTVFV